MEILLILFLIGLIGFLLFLLYKLILWISRKKTRIYIVLSFIGILIIFKTIDHFFFTKMEFIQSKVYTNLYLVKNEIKDRDSLHNIIKKRVLEKLDNAFITDGKKYNEYSPNAPYAALAFYTYTKNSQFSVFQDYGTAYFIDNEEDLGGFVVEDLYMYLNYKLATFHIVINKKDSTAYSGVLRYFNEGDLIKTDTLFKK